MATQFFSDEQMERLRSYPDIGREELIRFFTLTAEGSGVRHPGYRPGAVAMTSAVSPPEKFCWPVIRLPSRMAKLFHRPAWM